VFCHLPLGTSYMDSKYLFIFLFALILNLASTSTSQANFLIAQNGKARCVILRQNGATEAEAHAANDLADTLKQITGAVFPVQTAHPGRGQQAIVVGPGPLASSLFPEVPFKTLGGEELVIKTKGRYLLLAGGQPRGTLYAVYRFLEQQCGVRWWTPWASDIPHHATLNAPDLNVQDKPSFEYREPFWFSAFDGDWAVRHFYNGRAAHLKPSLGGQITYKGFVHTFYELVPPDKYFATHPEWYSLINGKRTFQGAQLCLTNQQLRDFTVERVRQWLKESPDANIISISQNDQFGPCECDQCKALDTAEGSHAATMISFVNYIAQKLEPEFPNVAFDTLAYQYTRHAPKTIQPRPNVIVRLCSIECNFAAPLDDPSNAAFANDIRDWSKLCNRLYIWDYVTNFGHYVQPHPNWFVLGPNMRFFRDHHVRGVFEEGAYQSNSSEMEELRAWVLARLLWNPNADDNALINEFLNGYYGNGAARYIRQYLDLLHEASHGYYLTCGSPPDAPSLKFSTLAQAEKLWQQAESATQNNSEKLWRVRQGHLPVRYVWLTRWTQLQREAVRSQANWPLSASRKAVADEWLAVATGPGPAGWSKMTQINEGGTTPQSFVARFAQDPPTWAGDPKRAANPPPPADLQDVNVRDGVDVQDDAVTLYREGDLSDIRPDAAASDGVAAWMPGSHHEWAVQMPVSKLPDRAQRGKWKVYVVLRVQKKPGATAKGNAFTAGIWDTPAGASRGEVAIATATVPDGYKTYLLGTVDIKPDQYFWVAPTANPDVDAIWVDRFYLVPA